MEGTRAGENGEAAAGQLGWGRGGSLLEGRDESGEEKVEAYFEYPL